MGPLWKRAGLAGLAAWNVAINRLVPESRYVPANAAAAVVAYAYGRAGRATRDDLVGPDWERGMRLGTGAAVVVAAATLAASRLRATAALFDDQRARSDDIAYQTLVRIPVGTVVFEEIAFRAVLPAVLDGPSRTSPCGRAAAWFGLWHVLPTLTTLDINRITGRKARLGAVTAAVATTAVAGVALDVLRLRGRSVAAPALAHWATNAVAYTIAARRKRTKHGTEHV